MATAGTRKPKILLSAFERLPGPRGLSCWLGEELRLLANTGAEIDVLTLKTEELSHIERIHGARVLRVPEAEDILGTIQSFQRALGRQLESEDYRLCHAHTLWDGGVLAANKHRAGYRLIMELQQIDSLEFRALYPREAPLVEKAVGLDRLMNMCLAAADVLITGSVQIRDWLLEKNIPPTKIFFLPPAVDPEPLRCCGESRQPGTIVFLGRLTPWSGLGTVFRALELLPRTLPFKLQVICPRDDTGRSELEAKIQLRGLAKKVEFLYDVPYEKLGTLLARASVGVVPLAVCERNQKACGLPHQLLVLMAAGIPVVATRYPAVQQVVEDGISGLLVPPGDAAAFAEAIKNLMLDRELAAQIGNRARMRVEQFFSLAVADKPLREIYRSLTGWEVDTEKVAIKNIQEDTEPEGVATSGSSASSITGPFDDTPELNLKKLAAERDTTPIQRALPVADDWEEEIVFSSPEKEEIAEQSSADDWRVCNIKDIDTNPELLRLTVPSFASDDREEKSDEPEFLPDSAVTMLESESSTEKATDQPQTTPDRPPGRK